MSSVTTWLDLLKNGNHAAAQPLWERYFQLLVSRAHAALGAAPRRAADEEDVALNAFATFCRGVDRGRFPRLDDRNDLWHVLLMLTAQKAAHQVRDELRACRGGGKVLSGDEGLAEVIGSEPTPAIVAEVAEECRRLLDKLGDADLRSIAVWQMEGWTVKEISDKLGRTERTIARKLAVIRDLWNQERQSL